MAGEKRPRIQNELLPAIDHARGLVAFEPWINNAVLLELRRLAKQDAELARLLEQAEAAKR